MDYKDPEACIKILQAWLERLHTGNKLDNLDAVSTVIASLTSILKTCKYVEYVECNVGADNMYHGPC